MNKDALTFERNIYDVNSILIKNVEHIVHFKKLQEKYLPHNIAYHFLYALF
jgi:hypothetical protein